MHTYRVRAALIALSILLAPGLAMAQVPEGQATVQTQQQRRQARRQRLQQRFEARFRQMDTNHDGVISRDEWTRRPQAFDRIDTNHDAVLTQDELKTVVVRAVRRRLRRR